MDESHRLKPMVEGYDQQLFNTLYKETKNLRKKLAYDIVSSKFGVDNSEVLSWFEVKFLYAFNKYYGNDKIKGYIINSLKMYQRRIIMSSYQPKFQVHNSVDIDEVFDLDGEPFEDERDEAFDDRLVMVKNYLKERLSSDAYFVLEIELNPPQFILNQLKNADKTKIPKIPAELIAEYLGIEDHPEALNRIAQLRVEAKEMIKRAREYFQLLTS